MIDIAAGQSTTFFIARPPATEAAKEEAKELEVVAPASFAAPAAPEPAPEPAPAPAADESTPTFKPSIDLSGFGFAFGAPPAAAASNGSTAPTTNNSKAASPGISEEERKKNAVGISRTIQAAWEELPRYPAVTDVRDECVVCGKLESDDKGDSLECEKVRYHTSSH